MYELLVILFLMIAKNPQALQLRYLQTLNDMFTRNSSTIVFPLPIDLIVAFAFAKKAIK